MSFFMFVFVCLTAVSSTCRPQIPDPPFVLEFSEVLLGPTQKHNTTASFGDGFSQLDFPLIGSKPKVHQSEMWEAQVGAHTVRSHGVRVAKTHMHDWLILVLLGSMIVALNIIHPFYRFVGKDMMSDLKYPHKHDTVPFWALVLSAVPVPIIVFLLVYLRQRDVHDLHNAILGILFSALVTGVITDAIKDAVGRPRPDFFWRCFPDGVEAYDRWGNAVCHGDERIIRQGHKSFPSGHTSWAFAGLGFLSLYLSGKIKLLDRKGHVSKLCVVFLPLLVASLVGVSRVDDYRHHWQDVFAGGLLGLVVATFCYLQFFPPPYHVNGWRTYAYLRVLEELHPSRSDVEMSGGEIEIQPNQMNNDSSKSRSPVDDIESGIR